MTRARGAALVLLLVAAASLHAGELAVEHRGEWVPWWSSDRAPSHWRTPSPLLSRAVVWSRLQPGLELAEVSLSIPAPVFRLRLILLRIEPSAFEWTLEEARDGAGKPSWSVDVAPADVVLAINAGQFAGARPWGWVVSRGKEVQPPAVGPLSMAFVARAGGATLIDVRAIARARAGGAVATAFQTYPTLLAHDGEVPLPLRSEDRGVDLSHRDTRLAIGLLRDGGILVALTRFDIGGGLLRPVPLGPNVPEMAAIMGGLGCRSAVMLDGGISSQLLVRDANGEVRKWTGYRKVPLGLVARRKPATVK